MFLKDMGAIERVEGILNELVSGRSGYSYSVENRFRCVERNGFEGYGQRGLAEVSTMISMSKLD